MADQLLKQFVSDDGSKVVLIVRRDNGIFSYRCVSYGLDSRTDGIPGPYCGLDDSPATAEFEALCRVAWLAKMPN
jgi:hypothetical protein